jgi:serine/threonine-protein kinase
MRRDAEYGYAIAGLATIRHWQAYLRYLPPEATYTEARALAHRALALDSSLVDGWLVLGRIAETVDRDYDLALAHFARAVAVAPSDPRAYNRQAILLARVGRQDEALAAAQRGVELDPASPGTYAALAQLYAELDRYSDAEQAYRQALSLDPGHPLLLGNLALQLTKQRRYEEAEPIILEARRKAPRDVVQIGQHAFIASRIGKTDQARALLDTAESLGLSPVELASVWSSLGDTARALDLLERAVRERDDGVTFLLDTSAFVSLRGSPRYQQLVAKVRAGDPAGDH